MAPGRPLSVWITQHGTDAYVFWYHGDSITAADETAVISSIRYNTALPKP